MKKTIHILWISVLSFLIFSFLLSFLNKIHFLYSNSTDILVFIFMLLFFSILGFYYGKKTPSKGYLEGLKVGGILILFLIIINLIFFQNRFTIERTLYYITLILSSMLGSMIGINKKN